VDTEDKKQFATKIKLMLLAVDNNHVPSPELISVYWFTLKGFSYPEVSSAVDAFVKVMAEHITPAHIVNQIQGPPKKKLSAHDEMSKPHWERMNYAYDEEYQKANHQKWLKKNPV